MLLEEYPLDPKILPPLLRAGGAAAKRSLVKIHRMGDEMATALPPWLPTYR